jgi:SAM-dependent methyltransferase
MLTIGRRKATKAGLDVRFDMGRIDAPLPYPDAAFDLVVCSLVLTHYDDHAPIVRELAPVLRLGGRLLVTDFHPDIVRAGARTVFNDAAGRYALPNPDLTREDYLRSVVAAGLSVEAVVDIPMAEAPPGSVGERFRAPSAGRSASRASGTARNPPAA